MISLAVTPTCRQELADPVVREPIKPVEFQYNIPSSQTLQLWLAGMSGIIDWGDGSTKTITATSGIHSRTYASAGNYKIKLIGDILTLTKFSLGYNTGNSFFCCTTFNFAQMIGLKQFSVRSPRFAGNIDCLKNLVQMDNLDFAYSSVVGNIECLRNMTVLVNFAYGNAGVFGDISVFQNMPLTVIGNDAATFTGDIISLSGKDLYQIRLTNPSGSANPAYGDISVFATMSNLTTVSMWRTKVYGDLAFLQNLTKVTFIDLSFTLISNFTPVALPALGGEFYLRYCPNLSSQNVDDFIIALAVNAKNTGVRKLHMYGSTPPRTTASDSAVAVLVAKGWQITTNYTG